MNQLSPSAPRCPRLAFTTLVVVIAKPSLGAQHGVQAWIGILMVGAERLLRALT